jgi:hypothetical protein
VLSCSQDEEASPTLVGTTEQRVGSEPDAGSIGERASSPALAISWDVTEGEQRATPLRAIIRNTTQRPVVADFTLVGSTPSGDVVTRPVGRQAIAAQETIDREFALDVLPAQSEGLSSTVALYAAFTAPNVQFAPGATAQARTVQSIGPTLHVTFEPGAKTATFRSAAAQASFNSRTGDAFSRVQNVRIWDAASDSILDVTPRVKGAQRELGRALRQTSLGPPGMRTPPTLRAAGDQKEAL